MLPRRLEHLGSDITVCCHAIQFHHPYIESIVIPFDSIIRTLASGKKKEDLSCTKSAGVAQLPGPGAMSLKTLENTSSRLLGASYSCMTKDKIGSKTVW